MARTASVIFGLAAIMFTAATPVPQGAAAQDATDSLLGTWVMTEVSGRSWHGTQYTTDNIESIVLEISDHDGSTFAGTYSWKLATDDLLVDDGLEITTEAEEVVLGVRDFDGTYIMVDHPDTSVIRIKIVSDTTLEMVAYEPGPHAVVSHMTFERQ